MMSSASGWREANLGDICTFKYGKSLPQTSRSGGNFAVYGSNGVVGHHDSAITTGKTIIIGRKGSYGEINYSTLPCWPIDTAYFVDETSTQQDIKWLSYRLESLGLNQLNKAAAVPGLNREDAYRQQLLVPPLPEQRRIAAILDLADALRAKRREALAQLDSLTQSIFIEMFGDPVTNSKLLPTKPLNQITTFENGDRSGNYPSGDDIKEKGVLFLSTKNITDGRLDLTKSVYITEEKFDSLSRGKVRRNDLIITLRGTLGSCCIFDTVHETAFINAQMMIIRPRPECNSTYLHALLTSQQAQERFGHIGRGAAVPQLTSAQMASLQIPVPSPAEQQEFALRKKSLDELKDKQECAMTELESLFTSLQHRAFRGDL